MPLADGVGMRRLRHQRVIRRVAAVANVHQPNAGQLLFHSGAVLDVVVAVAVVEVAIGHNASVAWIISRAADVVRTATVQLNAWCEFGVYLFCWPVSLAWPAAQPTRSLDVFVSSCLMAWRHRLTVAWLPRSWLTRVPTT